MEGFVANQAQIFFNTFLGGVFIGIIYDIYVTFRHFYKPKKIASCFGDLLFWFFTVIVIGTILFYSNWGEIRGYTLLGFLIGVLFYFKFISKFIRKILMIVGDKVCKFIVRVAYIVCYPFNKIGKILRFIYNPLSSKTNKIYNKIKYLFRLPKVVCSDIRKYYKMIIMKKS
ncbi:spore cortex biosynthesis protein YabQ [Clostridiisalibacter paucivorans]|uniref:spore cortex biosynthesis protein YabQ n=1 Tax=Clostridiisalibacter paucivorans TaxID=408753 RepID=UPI000552D53F|nr:spore cortex biosynthesis protein YabQ [Clostridiisalibacter paucivorans]